MACPFPGMDPYIERAALWADFHDSLITCIRGALQPLIRPKYAALTQDRLFVVESDRHIYPDVALLKNPPPRHEASRTTVLEPDAPVVFELAREEIRQPFLTIIEPAAGNRVITAIEVLSPTNKTAGEGLDSYVQKREEYWNAGVNLVEIDLLREGDPTIRVSEEKLAQLPAWHYFVAVTRRRPAPQEVYPIRLERRLPKVAIPLASQDNDVTLDLQAVFARCWEEGPYPELLAYDGLPSGKLSPEVINWCVETLRQAGYRPSNGKAPNQ